MSETPESLRPLNAINNPHQLVVVEHLIDFFEAGGNGYRNYGEGLPFQAFDTAIKKFDEARAIQPQNQQLLTIESRQAAGIEELDPHIRIPNRSIDVDRVRDSVLRAGGILAIRGFVSNHNSATSNYLSFFARQLYRQISNDEYK